MRYFLDGNNLMGAVFRTAGGEDARERLFVYLQRKKLPKQTTVVFDGPPFKSAVENGPLRMLFSGARKADEMILSRISKGDVLVTRDRDLQSRARVRGAKLLETEDFLASIERKNTEGEKPARENDIEGWLKAFGEGGDGK